ncbi:MAG: hypothetical protein NTX79_04850 [Candidatus Micrarchaeota archaeon]|nr:hypothetical protein [Candidatus Micrarchaeota archaeon]
MDEGKKDRNVRRIYEKTGMYAHGPVAELAEFEGGLDEMESRQM